jgi:Zn-dependent protease
MDQSLGVLLHQISIWVLPVIFAITLHEAAHGYAARLFGDDTAWREGRVSLNPARHIDPVGTIFLPGLLLLVQLPMMLNGQPPILFGFAKPVPVNFRALRHPRRDMVWVAAAGPGMNIMLAVLSALLLHVSGYLPSLFGPWVTANLQNSVLINAVLAVFNMLPIPPLDGGRVAVGLLPDFLARPLAQLERYGILIIFGLLLIPPWLGDRLGVNIDILAWAISKGAYAVMWVISLLTGHM